MIVTTTSNIEGKRIVDYRGVVAGESIVGANIFRDIFAAVTDIVGGRSGAYESALRDARETAFADLRAAAQDAGGNAVVGVDIDYEVIGKNGSIDFPPPPLQPVSTSPSCPWPQENPARQRRRSRGWRRWDRG